MRCRYTNKETELLARLMRSEALGEGVYGMKLVGNVVINRVVAKCTTFKNINTIYDAIFQKGQFEGTKTPLFNGRPNKAEKQRAMDCIKYWRGDPAYKALFFQNPGKNKPCKQKWWGVFEGRYKNHCFYNPETKWKCGL